MNFFKIIVLLTYFFATKSSFAQLVVSNNAPYNTAQYIVQDVLFGGVISVSNIQYIGATNAMGYFDGTNSNIGINSGVVLSTGSIQNLPGPNNDAGGSGDVDFNLPGNNFLNSLISGNTQDAAVLQFDFIPQVNLLTFNFVFGSEEYMEYVNSNFNDVFGIFVTGINPNGGNYANTNFALIPNTNFPVSIDNVNANTNQIYYVNNENPPGTTVQLDGFTIGIQVSIPVVCNTTYTLAIAIADVTDGLYDSAVFFEALDLTQNTPTIASAGPFCIDELDQILIGTPTGGVWFGNGIVAITSPLFSPSLAGVGTHTITYTQGCLSTTTQITVNELPLIVISSPQIDYCEDALSFNLSANPTGGNWSGNAISNSGFFELNQASIGINTLTYDYTDSNGCFNSESIDININALPSVGFATSGPFCISDPPINVIGIPTGGTFTGNGISTSGLFNPSLVGQGIHFITYSYTDFNGCTNLYTSSITVHPNPSTSFINHF